MPDPEERTKTARETVSFVRHGMSMGERRRHRWPATYGEGRYAFDQIVETISRVAHTGNRGDGKIFVWPVEHTVRIQTGEMDGAAL